MGLIFSDDFTGTDGQLLYLRAGWSEAGNTTRRGSLVINTNQLLFTDSNTLDYLVYADSGSNDHWSSVELADTPSAGDFFYGSITPNGMTTGDYIRLSFASATVIGVAVQTVADGQIFSGAINAATSDPGGFPIAAGDVIEYRRVGNDVDLYKNGNGDGTGGIRLTATGSIDVSGTTTGLPESGISGFFTSNTTGSRMDSYKIGDFGPAPTLGWRTTAPNDIVDSSGTTLANTTFTRAVFRTSVEASGVLLESAAVATDATGFIEFASESIGSLGATFDVTLEVGDEFLLFKDQTVIDLDA